jgi:ornithine carbamoyltransferase
MSVGKIHACDFLRRAMATVLRIAYARKALRHLQDTQAEAVAAVFEAPALRARYASVCFIAFGAPH